MSIREYSKEALKFDDGKPPLHLLPWESLEVVAEVLAHGAEKYGEHNWRKGMRWGRLAGASLRHITAWIRGEDNDKESGKSHLAHAACCILFLLAYTINRTGEDTRYKKEEETK